MSKSKNAAPVVDEQRAADQDAAVEAAFVAGTLPEEDRRASEESASDEPPVLEAVDPDSPAAVQARNAEGLAVFAASRARAESNAAASEAEAARLKASAHRGADGAVGDASQPSDGLEIAKAVLSPDFADPVLPSETGIATPMSVTTVGSDGQRHTTTRDGTFVQM